MIMNPRSTYDNWGLIGSRGGWGGVTLMVGGVGEGGWLGGRVDVLNG